MKIISGKRRIGKTSELIITSKMTGYPIVTSNQSSAENIKNMAKDMNCEIPEPITISQFNSREFKGYKHLINRVLVDNVEFILEEALTSYLGVEVVTAVLNKEK